MIQYSTKTIDGTIPHLVTQWRGYDIHAPVKIKFSGSYDSARGHGITPIRDSSGYLIYAAPGGGEIRHEHYAIHEA